MQRPSPSATNSIDNRIRFGLDSGPFSNNFRFRPHFKRLVGVCLIRQFLTHTDHCLWPAVAQEGKMIVATITGKE